MHLSIFINFATIYQSLLFPKLLTAISGFTNSLFIVFLMFHFLGFLFLAFEYILFSPDA
jgi:hypothetical protein